MSKALIISNHHNYSQEITSFLQNKKWNTEVISILDIMGSGSQLAKDNTCLIFVICRDFFTYSQVAMEMSAIIRNCTRHTPVYLLFESECHSTFKLWKQYAKRIYENILSDTSRSEALENIIRMEGDTLPKETFMSPMDWI